MQRNLRFSILVALVLALLLSLSGSGAYSAPFHAASQPGAPAAVTGPTTMLYQGYITVSGSPFNGTGYFKFIVTNQAGNATYWSNNGSSANGSEPNASVSLAVSQGYFTVLLGDTTLSGMTQALSSGVFAGPGRYLKVWFSTTTSGFTPLSPVPVASAPYALNAETLDGIDGSTFYLWGGSFSGTGVGLTLTSSNNTALLGRVAGASANSYASHTLWGDSTTEVGVLGTSNSNIGVYGRSSTAVGVIGNSMGGASASSGVYGYTTATSTNEGGVYGYSADAAAGVFGASASGHAVYGNSASTAAGIYGGYFTGPTGVYGNGEIANGEGVRAFCNAGSACWGVWASSQTNYALYANTDVSGGIAIYTDDNLHAGGYTASAVGYALEALNSGKEPLQVGDLVAVDGVSSSPADSSKPLLQVRKDDGNSPSQVIGVVKSAFRIELVTKTRTEVQDQQSSSNSAPDSTGAEAYDVKVIDEQIPVQVPVSGPALPGDMLVVQVLGLAQVRVTGSAGEIRTGDLLSTGPAGLAQLAAPVLAQDGFTYLYPGGTILGKALEPWQGGDGLIWVLIDLR